MSDEGIIAMNNLAEAINNYTNELKRQDPNRLLSAVDIQNEFGIGENQIYKIFNDPSVPVQKFTRPAKVRNADLNKYFETRHERL